MKRYLVSFKEVRRYEMTVVAPNEELAIRWARSGLEYPIWTGVDLNDYRATEIEEDAP